jgi:hypothetical protein
MTQQAHEPQFRLILPTFSPKLTVTARSLQNVKVQRTYAENQTAKNTRRKYVHLSDLVILKHNIPQLLQIVIRFSWQIKNVITTGRLRTL